VSRLRICTGFDGSLNNDHTALRAETHAGRQFTPTYGPDRRPTIWNPAEWGGEIPRGEVRAAIDEVFTTYDVERSYWDPEDWESEIDNFALAYGEEHVLAWRTNRITPMYEAIRRFETDLITGALTHDACPITALHVGNAIKVAKPGQKYVLAKASEAQKIDAAMASILAHEAAADARAAGWLAEPEHHSVLVFR
jgi:phage terminase large subunit-like protein